MSLNPKQQRFVEEYIVDLNGTQAAIRAGYSKATANEQASQLLAKLNVQKEIQELQAKRSERTEITADLVLQRWYEIATADPNELIQHRRAPCRHCNGIDHAYQWKTEREFQEACELAAAEEKPAPRCDGGFGYSVGADINLDCPECSGEGIGYTMAVDTRFVSRQARMLYAGVKQTKDGLEIKMQDQGKALENVARHLGMFKDKGDGVNIGLNGITFVVEK